ncbi:transcription termination factor NusA [Candidatus Amarolinea aalborgensis]|uniref:transcription termination factor NusA n=1 Tax=Candidatus Amarolinea aalborgensis TaxID=2249329 RepID=UPI003BFA1B80
MRNELIIAINQICSEKALQREVVVEAIEQALVSAYKKNFGATGNIMVKIDQDTGQIRVFSARQVVDKVTDSKNEVLLEQAKVLDRQAELGGTVYVETTPTDFGRIAAQTAKQVILQRIREAEREATFKAFADRENEIISGTIQRVDFATGDVTVGLDRGEAVLPKAEQIPNERYRVNGRLRAYLTEVQKGTRGPMLKLSRTHRNMLRRLLELEVPEIANGVVEIKSIAREPGQRSKVAVAATQFGVDPVGSCVGMRGVRIQNIVTELSGEKIDVVEWSSDPRTFIISALSPAKVNEVYLEDRGGENKTAIVVVPDRQLSLAIGKEGQNARLAAKLTGWRIDIKSETDAAKENLSQVLVSKARQAVTPERDLLAIAEQILRDRAAAPGGLPTFDTLAVESRPFEPAWSETAEAEAQPEGVEASEPAATTATPEPAEAIVESAPEAAVVEEAAVAAAPAQPADAEVQAETEAEAALQPGPAVWDGATDSFQVEISPEDYTEFVAAEGDGEESLEAERERKRKRSKKQHLVFDETRGAVVSVRRHKREQSAWDQFDEE